MKFKLLAITFFIVLFSYSQYSDSASRVFRQAGQSNRPVLLVFSGSDWCQPCIRFEKKILDDSSFLSFSDSYLLVLRADFPQRKKQSASLINQNEMLARKFNPQGLFPFMILLGPDQKIIHTIIYDNEDVHSFIKLLKGFF